MNKYCLTGAVLAAAIGLGIASPNAVAASQQTTLHPAGFADGIYHIVFDGFCDGMTITKPGSAGAPGVEAVHTGDPDTCIANTPLFGGAGNGVGLADAATGTNSNNVYYAIRANRTWVAFISCDTGEECVLNSGTWSFGTPEPSAKTGLPSSRTIGLFAPVGNGVPSEKQHSQPHYSVDISFDTYCDGEHLNLPGSGGNPGVDGTATGCSSAPLIGARGVIDLAAVGMWDYTNGFFYVVENDHTFVIYNDCGDGTECFVNSGTWSFGTPPALQTERTAVRSSLQH